MKQGKYQVKGWKNEEGRKLFRFAGLEENEEVYLEKTDYTDRCACCGKTTYWTLTGEYETPVGTSCVQNLKLAKLR